MSDSPLPITVDPADLLYEGETPVDTFTFSGSRIVVTSHRVLVMTPDGPGSRFRTAYRPNITGVGSTTTADGAHARRAIKTSLYGVVLLAAGYFINLDTLVAGVDLSGTSELGGASAIISQLLRIMTLIDDLLFGAGVLTIALACLFAIIYVWRRERSFTIELADDAPIRLPIPTDQPKIASALRTAIANPPTD